MLPCHIFISRAGHRVRLGCPAGPAAFRGLPLLGKRPQNRCGKRWAKLFTGLPWFDGQAFGFCTLGKANSSLLLSLSSVRPVGQLWWGRDGWGASWLTLGFASPASCRRKKQKFMAKPLCTCRTLPSGKETGIVFSSLDFFFFFHVKIHCVKLVKSLEYVQTAVTVFYFCI